MRDMLSRAWWSMLLRGVVLALLGVIALVWPGLTLAALVFAFAFYAFADGVFSLAALFSRTSRTPWWSLLLGGLLSLGAGVVALALPGLTALALLYLVAVWAVLRGFMDIVLAVHLRKEIQGEWLLGLAGAASIVFGVVLVLNPGPGMLALLWLLGIFALISGVALTALAFRLRSLFRRLRTPSSTNAGSY